MARFKGVDKKIQVTRGFVTEFTPVAFPQEAASDIDNLTIDTDGSVRRRGGLDVEPGSSPIPTFNTINDANLSTRATTTFLWEDVGNSGTLNLIVHQIGEQLLFISDEQVSSKIGSVQLDSFATDLVKMKATPMEMASGNGELFVVSPHLKPVRISHATPLVLFDANEILIRIRDFEGLEESVGVDQRLSALSRVHSYNIQNQGWTEDNIFIFGGHPVLSPPGNSLCARQLFLDEIDVFPSNADIMSTGIVTNENADLVFDRDFILNNTFGNSPAPKGHFILDPFFEDRNSAFKCSDIPTEIINTRPQAVEFHQGRVFYSFPNAKGEAKGILYSQQLTSLDKAGKCFQEADPTAPEINELVATDGGFVPTPGVGTIYKLKELGNGIVVITSNGLWYLTGAELGTGFTATSLRLDKISTIGALSSSTVISAEGSLFYWSVDGIIQIQLNPTAGFAVDNITKKSIQTFYVSIPGNSRIAAQGTYFPEQRKVVWVYRNTESSVEVINRNLNALLILDLDVQGYYKYTISESIGDQYPIVLGVVRTKPTSQLTIDDGITTTTGEVITDTALTPITVEQMTSVSQITQIKLPALLFNQSTQKYDLTFSTFHQRSFTEWLSLGGGGLPMDAFVEFAEFDMGVTTQRGIQGGTHTKGTATYVHSFFSRVSKNLEVDGYYELPL